MAGSLEVAQNYWAKVENLGGRYFSFTLLVVYLLSSNRVVYRGEEQRMLQEWVNGELNELTPHQMNSSVQEMNRTNSSNEFLPSRRIENTQLQKN